MKLNGPNASGQTNYLSLSGLEVYGEIRGLADEDLGMPPPICGGREDVGHTCTVRDYNVCL